MKKFLSILLALAMLLGMNAWAEGAVDYTGFWMLTQLIYEEQRVDAAKTEIWMTLELRADGVAVLTNDDGMTEGNWTITADGAMIYDGSGDTMQMTLQNEDELAVAIDSVTGMAFKRGRSYTGSWMLSQLKYGEQTLDAAALDVWMTLELEMDGTAVLVNADGTTEYSWMPAEEDALLYDGGENPTKMAFSEDGCLLVYQDSGSCLIFERTPPYIGCWLLKWVIVGEQTVNVAQQGRRMTLEIRADGTAVMADADGTEEYIWTEAENCLLVYDGSEEPAQATMPSDNALMLSYAGGIMLFERGEPEVLAGLEVSDFNGDWELDWMQAGDVEVTAEEANMEMYLTLQDGMGHYILFTEETEVSYDVMCEVQESEDVGSLMLMWEMDEYCNPVGDGMGAMLISSGELALVIPHEGNNVVCYFTRSAE